MSFTPAVLRVLIMKPCEAYKELSKLRAALLRDATAAAFDRALLKRRDQAIWRATSHIGITLA
jgi:hypothetical protein